MIDRACDRFIGCQRDPGPRGARELRLLIFETRSRKLSPEFAVFDSEHSLVPASYQ